MIISPEEPPHSNEPLSRGVRAKWYWGGIGAATLLALLAGTILPRVIGEASALGGNRFSDGVTFLGATTFFTLPLVMGMLAAWFWRPLKLSAKQLSSGSISITLCGWLVAALLFHEGVICLIMATPLVAGFIYYGCVLGNWLFRKSTRLHAFVIPLAAATLWHDATTAPHLGEVRDVITVRATAAEIWPLLPSFPALPKQPNWWLYNIGLPYPVQSVTFGKGVGSRRECRLSQNLVIGERITRWQPEKTLEFAITQQPQHPEIAGHLDLLRGRFDLRDNGDGTCTLAGTSWYRLHVQPSGYFGLWADAVIRRVHLDVMQHIKSLAESQSTAQSTVENDRTL